MRQFSVSCIFLLCSAMHCWVFQRNQSSGTLCLPHKIGKKSTHPYIRSRQQGTSLQPKLSSWTAYQQPLHFSLNCNKNNREIILLKKEYSIIKKVAFDIWHFISILYIFYIFKVCQEQSLRCFPQELSMIHQQIATLLEEVERNNWGITSVGEINKP